MTDVDVAVDVVWDAVRSLDGSCLDAPLRQAIGQEWATSALAEHASIASFSRFSLQLMAVGAPAELLVGAHRAALDEIRHAELSFAVASVFLGLPIGPGPFPMADQALGSMALDEVLASAIQEGCVGETIAALEAAESAELATVPAISMVLRHIARDEAAHAALSWRFVAWAVERGGASARATVERAFIQAMAGLDAAPVESATFGDEAWVAYGRWGAARRQALARRALVQIVQPALHDLLAGASSAPAVVADFQDSQAE